jgi:hypothetical protein
MTTRLFFLLVLICSKFALAQDNVLQTPIDLDLEDASLEQVLKDITGQTGIHFSYDSRLIDTDKKTSLNFKGENFKNVLEHICGLYDLEYSLVRNQIVLRNAITYVDPDIRYTISGHIRDKASGETLPGATVIVKELNTGTTSNAYGFYSISLPLGQHSLIFSFVGFKKQPFDIDLEENLRISIELEEDSRILGEVTVIADENLESLQKSQSSLISVNPRSFEQLPEFAGENGLIKSLQTLPGIQTHSDGSSFFFVRGGNKDQNLILIDEAPVYNPAHLFGFYSVIIPDVAKEINIYKADMPVDKAGRLSSLIDVHTRDGNMKKFNLEGVLNPLMYRFSIESPIVKEKASFYTSYRRSNFEWLYKRTAPEGDLYIQDFNAKINWRINDKNRVFFSVFRGNDNYTTMEDQGKVGVAWHNFTTTARWNHIFSDRLFSNATLYASEYNYTLFTGAFPWESGIKDLGLKYDFSWFLNPDLTWRFGFSHINHEFNPGNFSGYDEEVSAFIPKVYAGKASETAFYFNREKRINDKWSWKAGIRLPFWLNRGPAVVFDFDDNQNVTDTLIYQPDQPIQGYLNPDIRISARYRTGENSSLRFSWGNYHQNLHLLSNSISPFSSFELWMPSSRNIKPQRARQLTAGFTRIFPERALELGLEVYNKRMFNQIEYVNHAKLLLNPLLEGELHFGENNSYGIEFYLRRTKGRFTGWASYTLSRVFNHFEDINDNQKYPAFYDRPHDVSVFFSWQASPKVNLSLNWVYFTGSAITTPVGYYQYNGSTVPLYGLKNNDRLPDYHRLDFSFSWNLSNPQNSFQHSLNFGLYNLYNRINPVSINFNKIQNEDGNFVVPANYFESHDILSTQKYLGGVMPSVTYKFKIR